MENTIEEREVEMVENNPSNPASFDAVVEGGAQPVKEASEDEAILKTEVSNEAPNVEKMETNQDSIVTVEETSVKEETVENGNAGKTSTDELSGDLANQNSNENLKTGQGEETHNITAEEKSTQDEVQTAINEQELKYWQAVKDNPQDFTCWTYLLQFVEQENKLNSARKAFESFLSRYPFCYGYWKKFADMEKKNGDLDRAREVFEKGVEAISLSVDLWVHYLNFTSQTTKGQPNNSMAMRSLFERAISVAGEEFRSDKLWDAYIEWEKSQKQLQKVTAIYDRVLTVPTQYYAKHWKKFQDHINTNPLEDVLIPEELLKMKAEVGAAPPGFESEPAVTDPPGDGDADPTATAAGGDETTEEVLKPEDPETSAVRKRAIAQRKVLYDANEIEVSKRWTYEEGVKRPYFHVKPLERVQLKNWRDYLDFEVSTGNHRRVIILFERCVIACALYEEFWQRFASYMEVYDCKEGCLNVYKRACRVHLPDKPHIHLAWAAFEEKHGNVEEARKILQNLDKVVPGLAYVKLRRANIERRSKEIPNACAIYEQAIEESTDVQLSSFYAVKYAKLLNKVAKNFDQAREVLKAALEKDKENKRLYLQLLDLELAMPEIEEEKVEAIFDLVKNSTLADDVKEGFSQRRLEFLEDFSSNIVKITRAQEAHNKLYKSKSNLATGKKRANEEGLSGGRKVVKTDETTDPNQFNNMYDSTTTDYSAAAGYPANSTYNYNTAAAQWPGYGAAQQPVYSYGNWYQQYGQNYAQ